MALEWAAFEGPAAPPAEAAPERMWPEVVSPSFEQPLPPSAIPPRAAKVRPTPPKKTAPPRPSEAPAGPFAAERAYLRENPYDYDAWLMLARAMWQVGEKQMALEAYSHVIRAGKLLDSVILDLEEYTAQWPDAQLERVLGDAYMKANRPQDALSLYRRALEAL